MLSDELCKYCKKPMTIIQEGTEVVGNILDKHVWIYECHNEGCVNPRLIVDVCPECEHEEKYWEE